jgi:hypothetical protein
MLDAPEVYPFSQTIGNKVVLGHFEPAGHIVQLVELPTEYLPAMQGSGNMFVNAHWCPGGHIVQETEPAVE